MRATWCTIGLLSALALVLPGLGCRSAAPSGAGHGTPAVEVTCFNARNITSFVPLAGPYLYIQVGNHEHYLLTLDRPSKRLELAYHIEISRNFDRVCSDSRAPLTYHYQGHVGVYDIIGVESVKDRAAAEALANKRTQQQPQP
jgi:hypothetical protein